MTTIIQDTFTGTGNTTIHGRAPDTVNLPGHNWNVTLGSLGLTSDTVRSLTNADTRAVIDSGVSDCVISLDMLSLTTSLWQMIICRYSDSSNFWAIQLRRADGGTPALRIVKVQGGSGSEEAANLSYLGFTATVTVTLSGTSISASFDGGSSSVSTTSAFNQTATIHGFASDTISDIYADNFLLTGTAGGGGSNIFPAIRGDYGPSLIIA